MPGYNKANTTMPGYNKANTTTPGQARTNPTSKKLITCTLCNSWDHVNKK